MIIPYIYIRYLLYILLAIGLPVVTIIVLKIIQKWTMGKCTSLVCLTGKTAIVTGGSTGIGFETSLHLASRGCRVIIADKEGGVKAKNKIIRQTNNTNIVIKYLDLMSLKSVRDFAKEINENEERLDILINNASVDTVGNKHTEDGLHETMQVNHFAPFLLTHLLVDLLKKSAPSRIIFVSSASAFFSNLSIENLNYPKDHPLSWFRTNLIYGNSKLCNIISANGFAERLEDDGIVCNSLHPGWVNKKIMKNSEDWTGLDGLEYIILSPLSYFYGKTPREGAQTTLHLAMSNSISDVNGKHFWDCLTFPLPPGARNRKFCRDIWEESETFVKLSEKEKIIGRQSKAENKVVEVEENKQELEKVELSKSEISIHNSEEEKTLDMVHPLDDNILGSSAEETKVLEELGRIESTDDEMELNLEEDTLKEHQYESEKLNGFPRFRKSKNGKNFITLNGSNEYSESKDRS